MEKTILVVDDNMDTLSKMCGYLNNIEYITLPATSSRQALGIAFHKKPDLIIYDMLMPGFNIISFCEILRLNPDTAVVPVLCISPKTDNIDMGNFKKKGIVDILFKPVVAETLLPWLNNFFQMATA